MRCLSRMTKQDALLLIENAVIVLNPGHCAEKLLIDAVADKMIHALEPDLNARGIKISMQLDSIQPVDYNGFVELVEQHTLSCYWK